MLSLGGIVAATPKIFIPNSARGETERATLKIGKSNFKADVVIVGGGVGGCAAALGALRNKLRVVMTEETDWIGGQLTQQGVPPDEHRWIESFGCTRAYRDFRNAIRDYYRKNYPLTESARARWNLNPGNGAVSKLCHEPRVAVAVLQELFAPYLSTRQLVLLLEHKAVAADVNGDEVRSVAVRNLRSGNEVTLEAPFFIDATELGDLLPLTYRYFLSVY
jgi:2-polyprenyl-6-methoxyphenol hydroxylase-like FAD-dependent oxidoreductase